jgi:flagellar biosynthesis/type III secretory pathway protein FliH
MNIQKLIETEAEISIHVHPEDLPVRGNYIVSGDEAYDKEQEDKLLAEMEWNEWAWCTVEVKAKWEGLTASAFLGGVVEKHEESFRANGYFDDMKHEAISELVQQVAKITQKINN